MQGGSKTLGCLAQKLWDVHHCPHSNVAQKLWDLTPWLAAPPPYVVAGRDRARGETCVVSAPSDAGTPRPSLQRCTAHTRPLPPPAAAAPCTPRRCLPCCRPCVARDAHAPVRCALGVLTHRTSYKHATLHVRPTHQPYIRPNTRHFCLLDKRTAPVLPYLPMSPSWASVVDTLTRR